jgi:hypothetical protein
VSTGGTDVLVGQAITRLSDGAVKSNIVSKGTADNLTTGLKIFADPKSAVTDTLMNKSLKFAKENDPTNSVKNIEDATNTLSSLKRPGKLSDVKVAAKILAEKTGKKNSETMVSAQTAEEKWKSYILTKINGINKYLIDTKHQWKNAKGETKEYNGVSNELRTELRDALFSIFKRNSHSKTLFIGTLNSQLKLKAIVDFYARPDVRATIDGKVSFKEEFYLSHFMKQYLTHNGIFNMPRPDDTSKSLGSNQINLYEYGDGDYAGNKGLKLQTITGDSIFVSIEQAEETEHRKNEFFLILECKDESGKILHELPFSEYFGLNADSSGCSNDSCKKCGPFSRLDTETINCQFSYNGDLQVWFGVNDIENSDNVGNERGFYWLSNSLPSNIRKAKSFTIRPDRSKNNNDVT